MSKHTTPNIIPELLSAKDAAILVGCGESTWRTWAASGKTPPSYKLAGKRVWKRSEVLQWIDYNFPSTHRFIQIMEEKQQGRRRA